MFSSQPPVVLGLISSASSAATFPPVTEYLGRSFLVLLLLRADVNSQPRLRLLSTWVRGVWAIDLRNGWGFGGGQEVYRISLTRTGLSFVCVGFHPLMGARIQVALIK